MWQTSPCCLYTSPALGVTPAPLFPGTPVSCPKQLFQVLVPAVFHASPYVAVTSSTEPVLEEQQGTSPSSDEQFFVKQGTSSSSSVSFGRRAQVLLEPELCTHGTCSRNTSSLCINTVQLLYPKEWREASDSDLSSFWICLARTQMQLCLPKEAAGPPDCRERSEIMVQMYFSDSESIRQAKASPASSIYFSNLFKASVIILEA